MKKSVYNAPPQRDFQSKEIKSQTYIDMLPGHTVDPDIEVSFKIATVGKGQAVNYVRPEYMEEDKEIPIDIGSAVDFRRTSFPIMSALYNNEIRFQNQRNEIKSNDESAAVLLPYLVPAMELANSYSIVQNTQTDDFFDSDFNRVDAEQLEEARVGIVGYDPRGFDGRVVLRLASSEGDIEYMALPEVGQVDASMVEHPTLHQVGNINEPFIPLSYEASGEHYQLDEDGFRLYLNIAETGTDTYDEKYFTVVDNNTFYHELRDELPQAQQKIIPRFRISGQRKLMLPGDTVSHMWFQMHRGIQTTSLSSLC